MIYHLLALEFIPSGMTCLGYSFLVPGMIFIIGGQGALDDNVNKINFELYRPTEVRNTNVRTTLMPKRTESFDNSFESKSKTP
jgi:dipeptide/tripeptide permease